MNLRAKLIAAAAGLFIALPAQAGIIDINVDGVVSNGVSGSEIVLTLDLATALGGPAGAPVRVDGIGWDVTIEAFSPSWLSEASVDFNGEVVLTVGVGDDVSGTMSYSSGGIVDLVGLGLDFTIPDGILVLTFFETFNDFFVEPDAAWSGTISVSAEVPEPGTLALFLIAGLGLVAGSRKKK